jgi:capsular polysaccharide transport system permease protein
MNGALEPARGMRSSLQITLAVLHALLMREALQRLFSTRAAWAWLLAEPLFHIGYLTVIYTMVRVRSVGGIDLVIWLLSGLMAFFLFRRTASQVGAALKANRALFTYRQIKPLDTFIARALLEGALMVVLMGVVFLGATLLGHTAAPEAPLIVLLAFGCVWIIGFAWGLFVAVASDVVPELGNVIDLISRPLYLVSGVAFPLSMLPPVLREWLMLNPLAHLIELVRLGIAPHYHAAPEANLAYPYAFALVIVFAGLLLLMRFEWKVLAR